MTSITFIPVCCCFPPPPINLTIHHQPHHNLSPFYNLPYSQHLMSLRQCNRAPCAHCLHVSGYPNHNSSLSDTSLHLHLSPGEFQTFCSQVRAKPPVLPNHAHQTQERFTRWRALFFCSLTLIHQTSRLPYVYRHSSRPIAATNYQPA